MSCLTGSLLIERRGGGGRRPCRLSVDIAARWCWFTKTGTECQHVGVGSRRLERNALLGAARVSLAALAGRRTETGMPDTAARWTEVLPCVEWWDISDSSGHRGSW
jgi:hypothetical protein